MAKIFAENSPRGAIAPGLTQKETHTARTVSPHVNNRIACACHFVPFISKFLITTCIYEVHMCIGKINCIL